MTDSRENNKLAAHSAVLQQSLDLLGFLSAVAREVGPKPLRDLDRAEYTIWDSQLPTHRAVRVGPTGEREAWLKVHRVPRPAPVQVPAALAELLDPDKLDNPEVQPSLIEAQVQRQVQRQVDATLAAREGRADREASHEDVFSADPAPERVAAEARLRAGITAQFEDWVQKTWTPWAVSARPDLRARQAYSRLYDLYLRAGADSASLEVVWGQFVLTWRGEETIKAPLLTVPVAIEINPADGAIQVTPERPLALELDAVEGTGLPGLENLTTLAGLMRDDPPDPWSPEEGLALRRQLIAPMGVDAKLVDGPGTPVVTEVPCLHDGWVLVLRKRPVRQERFYRELARKITDEQFLPEAFVSVIADKDSVDGAVRALGRPVDADDHTGDRLLMPLPANDEQERIARQLATARGVTVQGPPGTGKSHTIVNLVCHLVAQGKRVLVTAEKEQALTVLRDKIPEQLRDLSLAVLGSTPAAMEQLRNSAQLMQDSLSSLDLTRESARVVELGATVDALRGSLRRTDAALVEALRSEEREYLFEGRQLRAAELAKVLASDRQLDVIPDRLTGDLPFPLSTAELVELVTLLSAVTLEDEQAARMVLPDESVLPTAAELRQRFDRLETLRTEVTRVEDAGLCVERIDACSTDDLATLTRWVRSAAAEARSLSGTWEDQLGARIRQRDPAVDWLVTHNQALRDKLAAAEGLATQLAGRTVSVPEGDPTALLALVQEWATRMAVGRKISLFSSRELKEFSASVQVDGYPPTTPAHLQLVGARVQLRALLKEIRALMIDAYGPCAVPVPAEDAHFRFAAQQVAERIEAVRRWWSEQYWPLADRLGALIRLPDPALPPENIQRSAALLEGAHARREERQLSADIDALVAQLKQSSVSAEASPLWAQLLAAVQGRRPEEWDRALAESRRLGALSTEVRRCTWMLNRITLAGAPEWAEAIRRSRGASSVTGKLDEASRAWDRARARSWLVAVHTECDSSALMLRSHADARQLRTAIVELASRSARIAVKENLKDGQRRALETWLTAVKRIGKGTGKKALRFQAAAREALPTAMGAVPIWIMPIYRVMENFDPRVSELFDVIVVDESSQCDLLSTGVLALGRKCVVVGDDKQTTPVRVGVTFDRITALQDQHLRGVPEAKLLTMEESLYSIAGRAFPSTIALREHFRCVPEIIGFSNRYYDHSIRPLREVSVPQIGDPLRVVRTQGVSIRKGNSRVNREEAVAVADQVAACVHDTAYQGLSMGVVTMYSGPQAQLIEQLIRERIGEEEFEARRLRVGTPPLFQGDERNVIFISMIAHEGAESFSATSLMYMQWANVAVSRAQDQLWVFHSMDPETLNPEDQRRFIIEYALAHGKREARAQLTERAESQFELDVATQILQRGYEVEAQHRVGSYRIDLVARPALGERLAIECDGDSFHGPEQWQADVSRQRVLERLGWTFWRVRASQYYLDPQAAMQPLWDRLEQMRTRGVDKQRVQQAHQEAQDRLREQAAAAMSRTRPIATVQSTAGPIATVQSTTGPIATVQSTTGPIGTVQSTAGPTWPRAEAPSSPEPMGRTPQARRGTAAAADDPSSMPDAAQVLRWAAERGAAPATRKDGSGAGPAAEQPEAAAARRWAVRQGFTIGEPGTPLWVLAAYRRSRSAEGSDPSVTD